MTIKPKNSIFDSERQKCTKNVTSRAAPKRAVRWNLLICALFYILFVKAVLSLNSYEIAVWMALKFHKGSNSSPPNNRTSSLKR